MTGLPELPEVPLRSRDHLLDGIFVRETAADVLHASPVLFVHGGMHGWWVWQRWQAAFARAGWRTYALSLPGHTDSEPVPEPEYVRLTLSDYAQAVSRLVEWLDAPPVLIAHSMGGNVAQHVARAGTVAALVLVTPVGPRGTRVRDDLPEDRPYVISAEQARKIFFHEVDDATFDAVARLLVPESPAALNDYTRGGVIAEPDVRCPILVLEAEHDRESFQRQARETAQFYGAPLVRVRGAGHDLMLEPAGSQTAAFVSSWLTVTVAGQLRHIDLPS